MTIRSAINKKGPARGGRPRRPDLDEAILKATVDLVLDKGFKALSMNAIAERSRAGRMTIYRRWSNKAAIVMDAFVRRVDAGTMFTPGEDYVDTIRVQMRKMARVFRGKDGVLIRSLLAEAQFDPELAKALREQWTMPRRRMAIDYFREGIRRGVLRPDVDPDAMIDVLYAPIYYRLQMGTGPLSDAYIDEIVRHAMKGLLSERHQSSSRR